MPLWYKERSFSGLPYTILYFSMELYRSSKLIKGTIWSFFLFNILAVALSVDYVRNIRCERRAFIAQIAESMIGYSYNFFRLCDTGTF